MAKFKSIIQETKGETVFLRGKAKWAHVVEPDAYGNFSVNIYPTDEALAEYVKVAEGLRQSAVKEVEAADKTISGVADVFKRDKEGTEFVAAKLPFEGYDGDNSIEFIGIDGQPIKDFKALVGNGSEVVIRMFIKPYYMNSNKMVGISNKFYAMQIVNLVEFKQGGSSFEDISSTVEAVAMPREAEDGEDCPF